MKKVTATLLLILIGLTLAFSGCTESARAKSFGGTMKVDGEPNKTVQNVTWKEGNLWVVYRDRKPTEKPEVVVFKEYSNFGIANGTVVITEK